MYTIAVYDIGEKRVQKVRKIFLKYLCPIQLSVFEGHLTEASYRRLRMKLKEVIDEDYDSIIFFLLDNPKWLGKEVIGKEKLAPSNIL